MNTTYFQSRVFSLFLILYSILSCSGDEKLKIIENENRSKVIEIVLQKISSNNANVAWISDIDTVEYISGSIYSAQLKSALIKDDRPALLFGEITDIIEKNGAYTIKFSTEQEMHVYLDLRLKCDSKMANTLLTGQIEMLSVFAILADIEDIERIRLKLDASISEDDEAMLEVIDSNAFLAIGRLVDLVYMGTDSITDSVISMIVNKSSMRSEENINNRPDFLSRIDLVKSKDEVLSLYSVFLEENTEYARDMENDLMVTMIGNRILKSNDVELLKSYLSYLYCNKAKIDTLKAIHFKK